MKSFILAAGEGTRLRPLTLDRPKPMLPISGRPVLEWIVLWMRNAGITDIVANLHYKPEAVTGYFGDGSNFGVRMTYSHEEQILGTAGGVKHAQAYLDDTFVLTYGDTLTDLNLPALVEFHMQHGPGPHVTISLYKAPNPTECGIVAVDSTGRVTRFQEKPPADGLFSDLANAGVLIIDKEILDYIPENTFYDFSFDVFPDILARGIPMFGHILSDDTYLIDIGTPEKYERAQTEWPTSAASSWIGGE